MKRGSKFVSYGERTLGAGPDGQFSAIPFRHGRPRLKRGMRDVSHGVGLLQSLRGSRARLLNRAFHNLIAPFRWFFLGGFQVLEKVLFRDLLWRIPLRLN